MLLEDYQIAFELVVGEEVQVAFWQPTLGLWLSLRQDPLSN